MDKNRLEILEKKHKKIGEFKIDNISIKDIAKKQSEWVIDLIHKMTYFKLPNNYDTIKNCEKFIEYSKLFNINLLNFENNDLYKRVYPSNHREYKKMLFDYFEEEYHELFDDYSYVYKKEFPKCKNCFSFTYISNKFMKHKCKNEGIKEHKIIITKKHKLVIIDGLATKFTSNHVINDINFYLTKNYPYTKINNLEIDKSYFF